MLFFFNRNNILFHFIFLKLVILFTVILIVKRLKVLNIGWKNNN